MLIILLTLATTSVAQTTRVDITSNGNYRSFLPVLGINFAFGASNGHQQIPRYEYPTKYDGLVNYSDAVYQGHGTNLHRRVDTQYGYQYPYESSNGQWNRRTVTEASQTTNRFENGNTQKWNVFDYVKGQTTEKQETIKQVKGINDADRFNSPVGDTRNISTQSYDAKGNNNYDQITFNYDLRGNGENDTSVIRNNETVSVQILVNNNSNTDQGSTNIYHDLVSNSSDDKNLDNSTEANMFTINTNSNTLNINNNIDRSNNNTNYRSKATEENEVTSTNEARFDTEPDRWVWSNGDEKVETTTPTALDDRAAFEGVKCPVGTVRIKDTCVDID